MQAGFVGRGGLGQRPHAGQGGRRHHGVQRVRLRDEGVRGRDRTGWNGVKQGGWIGGTRMVGVNDTVR